MLCGNNTSEADCCFHSIKPLYRPWRLGQAIFCGLASWSVVSWSIVARVLYGSNRSAQGLAEWMGIAWWDCCDVLYGSNRSDRNKKSWLVVKLILSNIFYLDGTQGFEFFSWRGLRLFNFFSTARTLGYSFLAFSISFLWRSLKNMEQTSLKVIEGFSSLNSLCRSLTFTVSFKVSVVRIFISSFSSYTGKARYQNGSAGHK